MSARHEHCPACGCEIAPKHKRSLPDHQRLFAIIAAAFRNWPESHEFQPDNSEHLRAWLICKAGPEWREATPIILGRHAAPDLVRLAIEGAIRAAGSCAFVVPLLRGVAVIRPKSMSFRSMPQAEFARLRDAIEDVLAVEIGVRIERIAA